ncbi:MAG: ATP-binding cassette domain-containing protein [Planctomycetes bacterium]|nr:ATP-binding cassette domain-containing protein [Planctomycetota bacterium]
MSPDKTVLQEVAGGNDYVVVAGRGVRVETFLEQFMFPGAMKHARVGSLSGGEKNRVLLAKLLCAGGNVLVLDEPTNDLDLASLRPIEDALLAFTGSSIAVSHDRWFLDRIATRIVHLDRAGARGARADRGEGRAGGVPGTAGCGRGSCRRRWRCGVTVCGEVAAAGRSRRGSGVLARWERGGMGPRIGARGRLRPGRRGRAQGERSRWWVPGGPGPVLELPACRTLASAAQPSERRPRTR